MYLEKRSFPGRLNEISLDSLEFEHHSAGDCLVFIMSFYGDCFVALNYDIETRLWDIELDNAQFKNIALPYPMERVCDSDAIAVIRHVLVYGNPVGAEHIKAIKKWRQKLQIIPATLRSLESIQQK
jgi:hypothetical protein